ncbi:MAG: hypothetical protein JWO89_2590, partial [Verrucomicrobiaceae bacterium]|nr:hypothetical protein [Verrucomicrobiaceae bacterium]
IGSPAATAISSGNGRGEAEVEEPVVLLCRGCRMG